MDPDNSRRSACDRCRGQKLRCVRPLRQSNPAGGQTLQRCERCVKAGTGCFSTLPPPRKLNRTERLPSPPNSTHVPSQKTPLHHALVASEIGEYQPGFGNEISLAGSGNGDGSVAVNGLSSTSASSPTHRRGSSQAAIPGWDRKRGFGKLDTGQSGPSRLNEHVTQDRQTRSLGDMQSPATGLTGIPLFGGMSRSPPPDYIGMGTFDFGMGLVPQSDAAPADEGATWMDMLLDQGKCSLATGKASNPVPDQAIRSKEDCLHRLSELSSRLLKDLGRMGPMKFSDILSPSAYCDVDSHQAHHLEGAACQRNAIGRMLNNSQAFLDTLQHLVPETPTGAESECSYSEDGDDLSCSKRMAADPGSPSRPLLGDTRNGSHKAFPTVDIPTILTVFTCYAWLLQTYDRIFSLLHNALVSETHLSLQSLPKVLPGLHVGGFSLDDQQYLQVEMLIHLSTQMLERIEGALRMNVTSQVKDSQENTQDVLDAAPASTFLDMILEQKSLKLFEGDERKGPEGVKQTMERVRRILKSIS